MPRTSDHPDHPLVIVVMPKTSDHPDRPFFTITGLNIIQPSYRGLVSELITAGKEEGKQEGEQVSRQVSR